MLDHKTSPFSFSLTSCLTFSTFSASSHNAEPLLFLSQSELDLLHRYRYWGNSFLREKGFSAGRPSKEAGGKAQISLPIRDFLTHFWVRWGVCYEDALVGRFWKVALCGQEWEWGFSTRSSWTAALPLLKGFQCSGSGHVRCFDSMRGQTSVPGLVWGQHFLLCACFGCMT